MNATTNMACEEALRKYIAAFDGTKQPFSETEQQLFDDLFHKDDLNLDDQKAAYKLCLLRLIQKFDVQDIFQT